MTNGREDILMPCQRGRLGDFGRHIQILIFALFVTQNLILKNGYISGIFCVFEIRDVSTQTQERVDNTKVERRSTATGFLQDEKKRD
jgi:hypothetical protein